MNYNPYANYGNYGYNPQNSNYMYPNYSMQPQPSTQPSQAQQQLNVYAFVDGIEGAKAYQVKPGTKMLLMESQGNVCYLKQVNDQGQTIAFETYDLVKREAQPISNPNYITKEEFEKEISQIKALLNQEDK